MGKQNRQSVTRLSGYETAGFANADVTELERHLQEGKRLSTFVPNFSGADLSKKQKLLSLRAPIPLSESTRHNRRSLTGNALLRRTKGFKIKYQIYANLMAGRDDMLDYKTFITSLMGCESEQQRDRCLRIMLRPCSMNSIQ